MSFGPHLMLDFYSQSKKLADKPWIANRLQQLVNEIGMRSLTRPIVVDSNCSNPAWTPPDATGVSGYIVLAESHISIHTFVEAHFVFMDIFSCKPFDVPAVITFLTKEFHAHSFDSQLAVRGMSFPGLR